MTGRFLKALAVCCLLGSSAEAIVVVYKGSGKSSASNLDTATEATHQVHFILDVETFHGTLVIATPKIKTVSTGFDRAYGLADVFGKTKRVIHFSTQAGFHNSFASFQHLLIHFQGKHGNTVLTQNGEGTAYPATLTGLQNNTGTSNPQSYSQAFTFVLHYNLARTQAANALSKTTVMVASDIQGEYTAKGYEVVK